MAFKLAESPQIPNNFNKGKQTGLRDCWLETLSYPLEKYNKSLQKQCSLVTWNLH